ncbi:uncharacterized protein LOC128255890 [Drosophila gunungcola]|uniref:uncharacterized protein LOC128255890 n=1 Tax=Drosophila gunungcola TaxID=103775 RepID=UPI0022DF553C|nr:uncharacterized protein LOC128255890 [Drosophila gunungcola]
MCSSPVNLPTKEGSSEDIIQTEGLANDLIDNILKEHTERGLHQESDSFASSCLGPSSGKCKTKVDHRLEYWKNMIIQRRALQERLRNQVGRIPEKMIFNRQGKVVRVLAETVGLPRHSAAELLGGKDPKEDDDNGGLPKISSLEVVGKKCKDCQKALLTVPCPKVTYNECSIELSRSSGGDEVVPLVQTVQKSSFEPSVRINGVHYGPRVPAFSPLADRTFTCHPFQRHLRSIVRIENSGSREVQFSWRQVNFFSGNDTLLEACSGDFVFDVGPFMLFPGEFRDVTVLYQPRFVAIVKQRWLLCTRPRIFLCRPYGFTLNLNGRCTPPKEYLDRLQLERLPRVPCLPPVPLERQDEILCPYARELEEREAFNRRNRSFQCRTHGDLERLKEFYERVSPSPLFSRPWDYSVHSLIHRVCHGQDTRQRIEHLSELTQMLDGLRGAPGPPLGRVDLPERLRERHRTKMIYVRGILASRLEEWQERIAKDSTVRDSIYFQLYGLMCNAAEDIVSVIESTAQI